jgi:hypothetical protein
MENKGFNFEDLEIWKEGKRECVCAFRFINQ